MVHVYVAPVQREMSHRRPINPYPNDFGARRQCYRPSQCCISHNDSLVVAIFNAILNSKATSPVRA
jgi:hypothetical protein